MTEFNHTIVAPATPPGKGGVAVVRISGKLVSHIITKMLRKSLAPRLSSLAKVYEAKSNQVIDEALCLYFKAPNSFTGEDVLEIHCHGGPVIVDNLIASAIQLGARLANPGEFTERAFLNNKVDLLQAEAIADMIDAHSKSAARAAVQSLQGAFSKRIYDLNERVIWLRMYVEAAIDFPEEEINFLNDGKITQSLKALKKSFSELIESANSGAVLRDGITLVIVGLPNAGKSSLINALVEREVAIVTNIEGTTRDLLKEDISINGLPVKIVDTAGIRESQDVVENMGIEKAWEQIKTADIILAIEDASVVDRQDFLGLLTDIQQKVSEHSKIINVLNKIDLLNGATCVKPVDNIKQVKISAKENIGTQDLKSLIHDVSGYREQGEGVVLARRRHKELLKRAYEHVKNGERNLIEAQAGELMAEELRYAQQCLSEMTGEFTSDDLLGEIFSNFCIGK